MAHNVTDHIYRFDKVEVYTSYSEAIIGPIVFPLSFALVAQFIVYCDMVRHRYTGKPLLGLWTGAIASKAGPPSASFAAEGPVLMHLLSETVFAIACIAQCATNWSAKRYVGLANACDLQGVYAGYYVFSATALTAISAITASRIIASPETARATSRAAMAAGLLAHAVAVFLASLPAMGVGEYIFPRDFCMPNIKTGMYSCLMFTWWLLSALGCLYAAVSVKLPAAAGRLLYGILGYYLLAWLPLVLIIFVYWADGTVAYQVGGWTQSGGECPPPSHRAVGVPVRPAPFCFMLPYASERPTLHVYPTISSSLSTVGLYGYLALVLHTNQLAIPILVGWRLRAHMSVALSGLPLSATAPLDNTEPRVEETPVTPFS
jgi:hypothetical protein